MTRDSKIVINVIHNDVDDADVKNESKMKETQNVK